MNLLLDVLFWAGIFSLVYIFQWMFRAKLDARRPSLSRHRVLNDERRKWGDPVAITTTSGIRITSSKKVSDDYHFYLDPQHEVSKQAFLDFIDDIDPKTERIIVP